MPSTRSRNRQLARILRQCLAEGAKVEIDGLGTFVPGRGRRIHFEPQKLPRVFLAYAVEDLPIVRKLYASLEAAGFDPWLDKKKLLPGQNWPRAIETAIESCDYFLACFSRRSVYKRGTFQSELRYALECASRIPSGDVFFIPLRLDDCEVPRHMARTLQYLDLFPDWNDGIAKLVSAIGDQESERARRP